jgi:hypothetical protein
MSIVTRSSCCCGPETSDDHIETLNLVLPRGVVCKIVEAAEPQGGIGELSISYGSIVERLLNFRFPNDTDLVRSGIMSVVPGSGKAPLLRLDDKISDFCS